MLLSRGHQIAKSWPRDTMSWPRVIKSWERDNTIINQSEYTIYIMNLTTYFYMEH
jgi:hypothetical protein